MYPFTFEPLHLCFRMWLWFRIWTKILADRRIWRKKARIGSFPLPPPFSFPSLLRCPFAWPGDLRSRGRIATPIKIRLVLCWNLKASEKTKSRNRKFPIMHGILGSKWPKMVLASYLKIKEETLLVYCLYFVGFLVRSLGGFECELPMFQWQVILICF